MVEIWKSIIFGCRRLNFSRRLYYVLVTTHSHWGWQNVVTSKTILFLLFSGVFLLIYIVNTMTVSFQSILIEKMVNFTQKVNFWKYIYFITYKFFVFQYLPAKNRARNLYETSFASYGSLVFFKNITGWRHYR